jgi:signal transduction histidine kinase/ActR/RegA family two-component response regulator
MNMLESGEAAVVSELLFTEERKGKFLWSDSRYAVNRYALISKSDYPYLEMYQVVRAVVGVMKRSAREDVYSALFPKNNNTKLYNYSNEVFSALESGEVDLMMSSEYEFLTLTNFLEKTGYKVNIMFSSPLVESFFGFNKNEEILRSVISKSLNYINTGRIEKDWVSRHFKYEMKMTEERARYAHQRFAVLIILTAVILSFLVMTILLLIKNKSASAQIKRANERLMLMLDTSPLCVQIWSRNLNTIDCNEAAVKLYGFKNKREYKEKFLTYCSPEYQPDGKRSDEKAVILVNKAFEDGYCSFDWQHKMPYDNTPIPADITLVRAKYINDDVVVGYTRDMREHRKLMEKIELREKLLEVNNAKLQEALEQVRAASKAKGDFLSNMSHEMRTPMNAIVGMTVIGKKARNIEEKNHALNKIGDASSHLLGVISDVLDMAKIEAGKLELSPVEYNFANMLKKAAAIIHFRADEKRQALTVNIDEKIPRFVVGDDQRLVQIITNLLANAVKFTPEEGQIRLGASLLSETDGYCELRVEVADSGIGISPEKQEKLFRAFGKAEKETSRLYGGTGLGLIITKNIVEMMGGKIWVESELGKGAKFIFTVTCKAGEKNEETYDTTICDGGIDAGVFEGKRLLVVEDFEINREILTLLLKDSGLVIDCAENGREALDIITASPEKYDIVFMDLQMPVMGGLEATRLIRALPSPAPRERLPIVAMTANVFKDDIEACIAAGMNGHLGKPLDIDKIIEVLRKYLTEPPS